MGINKRQRTVLIIATALAVLAGCATSSPVQIVPLVGAPEYPRTNPESVAVLHAEPEIPFETLGQVVIDTSGGLSIPDMERMLRDAGASMGANAVVIMDTMTEQSGTGSSEKSRGQVVSAIAIRYK
jgi:hypothetical protein